MIHSLFLSETFNFTKHRKSLKLTAIRFSTRIWPICWGNIDRWFADNKSLTSLAYSRLKWNTNLLRETKFCIKAMVLLLYFRLKNCLKWLKVTFFCIVFMHQTEFCFVLMRYGYSDLDSGIALSATKISPCFFFSANQIIDFYYGIS